MTEKLTVTRQVDDGIAGPLIVAFEQAWAQIRRRHPEVPPAVLITGSGLTRGATRCAWGTSLSGAGAPDLTVTRSTR